MSSEMKWKLVPVDDPDRSYSDPGFPDEMVWAGIEAMERAEDDLKRNTGPDWDTGMICVAVYRAMLAAAPEPPAPAGEVVAPVGKLRSAAIQAAYHFAYVASREESVHVRSDAYARADQAVIDAICRLASLAPPPAPAVKVKAPSIDDLAQEIRRVDGNHSLGAGALAEALMPFIRSALCEDAGADYMTATQTEMQKPENDGLFSTPAVNLHDCYRREQATKPFTPAPASDDLVERLGRIPHLFAGEAQARITSDAATIASLRAEAEKLAGRIRTQETRISSDAATISGLEAHIMHLDTEVLDELRTRAESAEAERDALKAEVARKDAALRGLLSYAEINECQHDDTYRGGFLWTICRGCGRKWADDEGGFVPYCEPGVMTAARAALAPIPAPAGEPLTFSYRNWRGEVAVRRVQPLGIRYSSTEWHPEAQWLLRAVDLDKGDEREFAMRDIGADDSWKKAFAAQTRKLQAVLHITGVRDAISSWVQRNEDPEAALESVDPRIAMLDNGDAILAYSGCPSEWRVKPEDVPTPREPGAGVNGEHQKTCSAVGKVVPENPERSENTPTLALLGEILHWAESRCPCHEEEPNPCPLCGASVENLEPCKSAENTLPRHLLKELRLAKAAAMSAKV